MSAATRPDMLESIVCPCGSWQLDYPRFGGSDPLFGGMDLLAEVEEAVREHMADCRHLQRRAGERVEA